MKGKIIELNKSFGYIEGEDNNIYFFNKENLESPYQKSKKVIFRANQEKIKDDYILYKATNIIEEKTQKEIN